MNHLGYVFGLCFLHFIVLNVAAEKALPKPLDLSMTWINESCINLSWSPPKDLDIPCELRYRINTTKKTNNISERRVKSPQQYCITLYRAMTFTVQTECNNVKSQPAVISIAAPTELVKNFVCYLTSLTDTECLWDPTINAPEDLQLYYKYYENNISACTDYLYNAAKKTGCHFKGQPSDHEIFFQINGTVNGSSVRNTFSRILKVKPLAPKVKIVEEGNELILSWDPPYMKPPQCWHYILNYSKCQEHVSKKVTSLKHQPEEKLPYDTRCLYRVQVKAVCVTCAEGESDWSQEFLHGKDDLTSTVVCIMVPVFVFLFVLLFLCCVMRYRKKLLPTIPQPSLIFKDMLHINKDPKVFTEHVYVPVEEKVECKISLEKEPSLPIMQLYS
ncbi:hypothetical protein UPYG_G00239520 [Umbra pygmaea]|uniref:Type I cytokine receptor cytokine-binding domain-containing protein n=1 Tax=Umbra pygmaea TaxID=75934 RepID=A0ABD0WFU0_UMBPY